MLRILTILGLLAVAVSANAQRITLGPLAKTTYCYGDTLFVPYHASGSVMQGKTLYLYLSDVKGTFGPETSVGWDTGMDGTFRVKMMWAGNNFRYRVACNGVWSDTSSSDIAVLDIPSPTVQLRDAVTGKTPKHIFVGEQLILNDTKKEAAGTTFLWQFDSNANPKTSTDTAALVRFTTDGFKHVALRATNTDGCDGDGLKSFPVLGCNPIIGRGARIITQLDYGSGLDSVIWVKAGGDYNPMYAAGPKLIFVEPGGQCEVCGNYADYLGTPDVCYVRAGGTVSTPNPGGGARAVVVMAPSVSLPGTSVYGYIDTVYCSDLAFDYSQVTTASVDAPAPSSILLTQRGDRLSVADDGEAISVRIIDMLGGVVVSQHGVGALTFDLWHIPAGIYFAVVEVGERREVRKIGVVH